MQTTTIAVDETPREVQRAPFASESGLHDFVEQHAEALLGVKIVASSRPRGNGLFKIDILAEDGDRRPWIIECKHDLVDAAAWSQLRRYRDALKEGWAEAAPRFGGGASREPVLVAIGYRFDRSVDADEVVRLAYRYHDVKLGADEVQTQTVGRVSLHPILGAADESAQRHPKVSKKNATVERLQRFAPHLAEEFWTVDAELRSLPGVKEPKYGGKNFVRYSTRRGIFAEAVIGSGVIEWRATVAREMRSSAERSSLLELLRQAHGRRANYRLQPTAAGAMMIRRGRSGTLPDDDKW